MRAILAGAGVAFVAGVIAACSASKMSAAAPVAASPQSAGSMPGDPHTEIDRLSKEIDDELAKAGVATMQQPSCAAAGTCSAVPMAVAPIAQDATCKPAKSDTCDQACTLSTSICTNADRICKLAGDLGGADQYANEKCQSGNESCSRSHERCCGCT
ncbi:MAG TPA: hypothetical protein VGM90_36215 [Kofleriaceae bacterium]|jgi:hypothetical protein